MSLSVPRTTWKISIALLEKAEVILLSQGAKAHILDEKSI